MRESDLEHGGSAFGRRIADHRARIRRFSDRLMDAYFTQVQKLVSCNTTMSP